MTSFRCSFLNESFDAGINEAAYHVIVELYDRGNVVLTDFNYIILNILRPRQAGSEDVRFAVREKYPVAGAVQRVSEPTEQEIGEWLTNAKEADTLKKARLTDTRKHAVYCDATMAKFSGVYFSSINLYRSAVKPLDLRYRKRPSSSMAFTMKPTC